MKLICPRQIKIADENINNFYNKKEACVFGEAGSNHLRARAVIRILKLTVILKAVTGVERWVNGKVIGTTIRSEDEIKSCIKGILKEY